MRIFTLCLAVLCLSGPAAAQGSAKLTPLPNGPALLQWVRSTLTEVLEGVTQIEPGRAATLFNARTADPALPAFSISVTEQVPAVATLPLMTNSFISSFRASCGPLRERGELTENQLSFVVHTLDCPTIGPAGLHLWIMSYKDSDRTQLIALSGSIAGAAAIDARGDKLAAALGMRLYPKLRSLVEAMAVALSLGIFEYDPADFTLTEPGRGRLRVSQVIHAEPAQRGVVEVHAPSCAMIRIREIEDGPSARVASEQVIDLQRFARSVTREGPNLNVRPDAFWEVTRFRAGNDVMRYPWPGGSAELMTPESNFYEFFDNYLLVWERFCASSASSAVASQTPAPATLPAAPAAQSPPPAMPQVAQTAPAQPGPAPQRACDREGSRNNIARGRASGVMDEPTLDERGHVLTVDAAWWQSVAQSFRQDLANIVHCASGRWGTPLALRVLDRTTRREIGAFGGGIYRPGPPR
jgi:hypothetical protein